MGRQLSKQLRFQPCNILLIASSSTMSSNLFTPLPSNSSRINSTTASSDFVAAWPILVSLPASFHWKTGLTSVAESQELFGRWRTMAYRAVRHPHPEDPHYLADLTEHLFDYLHALLSVLLPRQDLDDVLNEFAPRAHKVLQKAIKFQDVTQGVCVAWDYSVFFPASQQPLVPDEMEVDPEAYADHEAVLGKPGGGGVVLLPTVLGLMANRKGQQGLETNVVQKAKIVPLFPSPT